MKMYLISDNIDTKTGMRLAGVEGVVVHEIDEVRNALDNALKNKDIGIILITEKLGKLISDKINDVKLNYHTPLIVEIPDRHGTGRTPDSITKYVREAIGLKI
ncbi:MAG: V-type ATP synthase subunit F [Vallitalea sp.]|jgi:V/A-type H+-transporting ATPase subunit F|nr:V-type ATP synthase subunit F [Vallitalea sp.]